VPWVHLRLTSLFAVCLLLASACSTSREISAEALQTDILEPTSDLAEAPGEAVEATDETGRASSESDGTRADSSAKDSAPTELTNEDVYRTIENSIVYLQAPDDASGSGIVIDGGWILTNAHIVDRHQTVRVGRSDGFDLGMHAVHGIDWVFDLALVGPIDDASLIPIDRGVSADLLLGSRVLLAGFPDEPSIAPTPTLTEGIVSRRRSVAIGEYSFLQVDATVAPGQSGGALVNSDGQLVGVSGLEFGEGEFALSFAVDEMWPRVEAMISAPPNGLPSDPPVAELVDVVGQLRNFGFLVEVGESGEIDVFASGGADIWIDFKTLGGDTVVLFDESPDPFRENGLVNKLFINESAETSENLTATVDPGIYQIVVGTFSVEPVDVTVTSANPMRRFADLEDRQQLPVGQVVEGEVDWVLDSDRWALDLVEGQEVSIIADGIADTVLVVRLDDALVASSDDEGIGVFGTGSQVDFVAATTGTYVVEVGTFDTIRWGYLLEATVN